MTPREVGCARIDTPPPAYSPVERGRPGMQYHHHRTGASAGGACVFATDAGAVSAAVASASSNGSCSASGGC